MSMKKGVPTFGSESVRYWQPQAGTNTVFFLSGVEDIFWSSDFISLYSKAAYGNKAYPLSISWQYTGPSDPSNILCPEVKKTYKAMAYIAYYDNSELKMGVYKFGKTMHNALITLNSDRELKNSAINIAKMGVSWLPSINSKTPVPEDIRKWPLPSDETSAKFFDYYENSESVWASLRTRLQVSTNQEVMELFGVTVVDNNNNELID